MPIGNSEADYRLVQDEAGREPFLFSRHDGLFHMIYAGTMWPKAYDVLERFLQALAVLRDSDRNLIDRLRVHFVGTGKTPDGADGFVHQRAERLGLLPWVAEVPHRIRYIDVLNHLVHASAILILGSTEPHYTPSKVFQSVQAKRPIFALLHEQSTAVSVLRDSRAGSIVTFTDETLPEPKTLAASLADFIRDTKYSAEDVRWDAFESYSARNSAGALARALESALEAFANRKK
jgi:hypothetical protein